MSRGAACFAYKQLVAWLNISQQYDSSAKHQHQLSNSFQNSPILSIRFEVLNWHVSAWRCWTKGSITSIPISIARRLCFVCAALQSVLVCLALQIVQSASLLSFKFVFVISARKGSVTEIRTRAARPYQPLQLRLSSTWNGDELQNVPPLHTLVSICHLLRSSCAEKGSNFNLLTKTALMKRCARTAEIQQDC